MMSLVPSAPAPYKDERKYVPGVNDRSNGERAVLRLKSEVRTQLGSEPVGAVGSQSCAMKTNKAVIDRMESLVQRLFRAKNPQERLWGLNKRTLGDGTDALRNIMRKLAVQSFNIDTNRPYVRPGGDEGHGERVGVTDGPTHPRGPAGVSVVVFKNGRWWNVCLVERIMGGKPPESKLQLAGGSGVLAK